jgi:hypothetical protein
VRRAAWRVHFVDYLDDGDYYGIDINTSLLKAGRQELRWAGLDKRVHLQQTECFDASAVGSVSLHLGPD